MLNKDPNKRLLAKDLKKIVMDSNFKISESFEIENNKIHENKSNKKIIFIILIIFGIFLFSIFGLSKSITKKKNKIKNNCGHKFFDDRSCLSKLLLFDIINYILKMKAIIESSMFPIITPTSTATTTTTTISSNRRNYINLATGLYLDSNNFGSVYTESGNGSEYKRWQIILNDTNGYMHLKNVATGKCLESSFGSNVYALDCQSVEFQKWHLTNNNQFVNRATRKCLDSNQLKQVYTHICNGGDFQKWF